MQDEVPDYKKLYEESLQRQLRDQLQFQQDLAAQQQQTAAYQQELTAQQQQAAAYQKELAAQQQQAAAYQQEIGQYKQELLVLWHELNQLRRKVFGVTSDNQVKKALEAGQLDLFQLNAPTEAVDASEELLARQIKGNSEVLDKKIRKGGSSRMAFPGHLEVEDVIIDPEGDLSQYHVIGQEVTEILVHQPEKFKIKRIIRQKWALNNSQDIEHKGILIAPLPSRTVKRGLFDESVLVHLLISKYIDHLPLHRLQMMFKRQDIHIQASTLSDNVAMAAGAIKPIYLAIKREALANRYLQVDETEFKVHKSGKKGSCHRGYMWVYHAPCDGLVFFDYQPGRDHTGPAGILKDFKGVVQTDAYQVYQSLFAHKEEVTHLFCMAHIRRKFDEAAKHDLKRASYAVKQIAALYAVEKEIRESATPLAEEQIVAIRMERCLPVLKEMKIWLEQQYAAKLAGPIAAAIAYALPLWEAMSVYLLHGHLRIDNNEIENAIRPLAIGRKNYLFAGTHETAQNAAIVYSLFATCKKHQVNPYLWLTDVLAKINDPDYQGKYSDLMPHRWKLKH